MFSWYKIFLKLASFRNELDMLAKRIAKRSFNYLVQNKQSNSVLDPINITKKDEPILDKYDINTISIQFLFPDDNNQPLSISGNWIKRWKLANINVIINIRNFKEKQYEFIATELKNLIRHEIEHGLQNKINSFLDYSWIDKTPKTIMEGVEQNKKYLLNVSEINAYIREFMPRAKQLGVSIESLLDKYIFEKICSFNPDEIEKHIKNRTKTGIIILETIKDIEKQYHKFIDKLYSNRKNYNK